MIDKSKLANAEMNDDELDNVAGGVLLYRGMDNLRKYGSTNDNITANLPNEMTKNTKYGITGGKWH